MTLGFVIVTYNQPEQTLRLCRRLSDMFGDPPIAVHHDYSQCSLDEPAFPANVHFVQQWRSTRWGSVSVVDAHLSAVELLYQRSDPDWYVSLSTTDYPIQTAARIMDDLRTTNVDAFIELQLVQDSGGRFLNEGLGELAFRHPRFAQNAFNRYVAVPWMPLWLARRIKRPREFWVLRSRLLIERLTPFDGTLQCYAGDHWYTANRRVAQLLVSRTPLWESLHRHYRSRLVPEEGFYHTLIGNSPGLRVCSDNLRYTDWRGCYAHPRVLGRHDLPQLLASNKHFARKLADDPVFLAELDRAVETKAGPHGGSLPVAHGHHLSLVKAS